MRRIESDLKPPEVIGGVTYYRVRVGTDLAKSPDDHVPIPRIVPTLLD